MHVDREGIVEASVLHVLEQAGGAPLDHAAILERVNAMTPEERLDALARFQERHVADDR